MSFKSLWSVCHHTVCLFLGLWYHFFLLLFDEIVCASSFSGSWILCIFAHIYSGYILSHCSVWAFQVLCLRFVSQDQKSAQTYANYSPLLRQDNSHSFTTSFLNNNMSLNKKDLWVIESKAKSSKESHRRLSIKFW